MTMREQIERFGEFIQFIRNELPVFAEEVAATDLVALVTNRVVQKGEDHTGSAFSAYSTNPMSAFRLINKSRTSSAEKKVRDLAKSGGALSYKGFRELNNLNADKKNFEFTGEMWRKFGVVKNQRTPTGFHITMAGTTPASQQKIEDNSQREGVSVIEASEAERRTAQQTMQDWINDQANRILTNE